MASLRREAREALIASRGTLNQVETILTRQKKRRHLTTYEKMALKSIRHTLEMVKPVIERLDNT